MVAMSTFPMILERACRDRAVTQQQMQTFRQAWSGVTAILVVDPTVLPTINHRQSIPIEFLKDAFPTMAWNQPRNNRRAVLITSRYMTPAFADALSVAMGCAAERGLLPDAEFVEEARRAPAIILRDG